MLDPALAGAIAAILISIIGVVASRRKDEAIIASQLTGSALEMVESARSDCKDLRYRLDKAEGKIDELEKENRTLIALLDDLWEGIVILSSQLTEANIRPGYTPKDKPVFRGSDGIGE